jgi:hypothetical protein
MSDEGIFSGRACGQRLGPLRGGGPAPPGVDDLCAAADYFDCMTGRPAPTGDDLSAVPVFGRLYRVGKRGQVFTFVLLDSQAVVRGRLEGVGGTRLVQGQFVHRLLFHRGGRSAPGTLLARLCVGLPRLAALLSHSEYRRHGSRLRRYL